MSAKIDKEVELLLCQAKSDVVGGDIGNDTEVFFDALKLLITTEAKTKYVKEDIVNFLYPDTDFLYELLKEQKNIPWLVEDDDRELFNLKTTEEIISLRKAFERRDFENRIED